VPGTTDILGATVQEADALAGVQIDEAAMSAFGTGGLGGAHLAAIAARVGASTEPSLASSAVNSDIAGLTQGGVTAGHGQTKVTTIVQTAIPTLIAFTTVHLSFTRCQTL